MLVYLFGVKGFDNMVKSWGYSESISVSRFPAVSASFMRASMEKMYAMSGKGECWRIAWTALVQSVKSHVRESIGTGQDIAVKYGSIESKYHEVCLVDDKSPYIIIILSSAYNYSEDTTFVKNVAACARDMEAQYVKMKG